MICILTASNINDIMFLGVLVMHYLQSISPSIALGGELAYQRGPGLPGGQIVVVSAAGRYTNGESTISCSLGKYIINNVNISSIFFNNLTFLLNQV